MRPDDPQGKEIVDRSEVRKLFEKSFANFDDIEIKTISLHG